MALKILLKILPYLIIVTLLITLGLGFQGWFKVTPEKEVITSRTVLEKVEAMGKMELVKFNFQEIIEYEKLTKEIDLKLFKLKAGADSRAVLIAHGEAVGCIDLTLLEEKDVSISQDTTWVTLPYPELCYHKLNLDDTRLYSLETGYFSESNKIVEKAYAYAEQEILKAALSGGILEEARKNAELVLQPVLETLTNHTVIIQFRDIEEVPLSLDRK